MPSRSGNGSDAALSRAERARLDALRSTESLADLARVTGADTEHGAYFAAKREWRDLREKELAERDPSAGFPGECVVVDGREFCIHGITHADTPEERAFVREHVAAFLDAGATVYCEQGIRPMYFHDFPGVFEMDDYRWAMDRCQDLGIDSHVDDVPPAEFDGVAEDIDAVAAQFRNAVFELIESGTDVYGEAFAAALGDVASDFLMSHENMATGEAFEAFTMTRRAAEDPSKLRDLQHYYAKTFLPQPLEREWLQRHDREIEIVTHARNERMAEYVLYHADEGDGTGDDPATVHVVVGAAHQPGVVYYLEQFRDGERELDGFEPVG